MEGTLSTEGAGDTSGDLAHTACVCTLWSEALCLHFPRSSLKLGGLGSQSACGVLERLQSSDRPRLM